MASHASGNPSSIDSKINLRKLFDSIATIFITEAPSTFRTPISFVRWEAVNVASPKRPRQEIKMAKNAKMFDSLLTSSSLSYRRVNSWSENCQVKGNFGFMDAQT